jgi:hypothetical protein
MFHARIHAFAGIDGRYVLPVGSNRYPSAGNGL